MNAMNLKEEIWFEDESSTIGKVFIPITLFDQIRTNLVYFIDIPIEERAEFLVKNYGVHDIESLKTSLTRIKKRLGSKQVETAIEALDNGDLLHVAKITLVYYDKTYAKGLASRTPENIRKIPMHTVDHEKNAHDLIVLTSKK